MKLTTLFSCQSLCNSHFLKLEKSILRAPMQQKRNIKKSNIDKSTDKPKTVTENKNFRKYQEFALSNKTLRKSASEETPLHKELSTMDRANLSQKPNNTKVNNSNSSMNQKYNKKIIGSVSVLVSPRIQYSLLGKNMDIIQHNDVNPPKSSNRKTIEKLKKVVGGTHDNEVPSSPKKRTAQKGILKYYITDKTNFRTSSLCKSQQEEKYLGQSDINQKYLISENLLPEKDKYLFKNFPNIEATGELRKTGDIQDKRSIEMSKLPVPKKRGKGNISQSRVNSKQLGVKIQGQSHRKLIQKGKTCKHNSEEQRVEASNNKNELISPMINQTKINNNSTYNKPIKEKSTLTECERASPPRVNKKPQKLRLTKKTESNIEFKNGFFSNCQISTKERVSAKETNEDIKIDTKIENERKENLEEWAISSLAKINKKYKRRYIKEKNVENGEEQIGKLTSRENIRKVYISDSVARPKSERLRIAEKRSNIKISYTNQPLQNGANIYFSLSQISSPVNKEIAERRAIWSREHEDISLGKQFNPKFEFHKLNDNLQITNLRNPQKVQSQVVCTVTPCDNIISTHSQNYDKNLQNSQVSLIVPNKSSSKRISHYFANKMNISDPITPINPKENTSDNFLDSPFNIFN